MSVKDGDKVKVHYKGTLDDGKEFDNSEKHGKPLEFEVGTSQVIKGFENAVRGMNVDEEKDVNIPVEEAYGQVNPQLVQKVPRKEFPLKEEPKVGMMLVLNHPQGMKIPAKIVEIDDENITLDMNHPLAGKNLNFNIKLVEIMDKTAEEEKPAEETSEEKPEDSEQKE
ncbi:MAG: FKBP-type peptidyl-prolyl cis-trans isomerase [Candidatus Woesearchaeota archaeon]